MESSIGIRSIRWLSVILCFSLSACATSSQRNGEQSARGDSAQVGVTDPNASELSEGEADYGPEPLQVRPIVLVLGPGMARAFSYAGVFRALEEAKIPIEAIVGSEFGALIGALYAHSDTINRFEWALMKLKDDYFHEKSSLFSSFRNQAFEGEKIREVLKEVLGTRDLERAKIPVIVSAYHEAKKEVIYADNGNAVSLLRGAIAVPGYLTPESWDGKLLRSSTVAEPFPVHEARRRFSGPIIAINVMERSKVPAKASKSVRSIYLQMQRALKRGKTELLDADLVITPSLGSIGYLEFDQRTQAIFYGKRAINTSLGEIRKWVGLPPLGLQGE